MSSFKSFEEILSWQKLENLIKLFMKLQMELLLQRH